MKFKVSLQFYSWVMFHEDVQSKMKKVYGKGTYVDSEKPPPHPKLFWCW